MVTLRTLTATLFVAVLVLVGAGIATARDAPESTVVIDGNSSVARVKGSATQRNNDPFNVTGHADATANAALGVIFNGSGPVTCLDVRGNTAGATARIEQSDNPLIIGRSAYVTVVDGGPGGVDRVAFIPGLEPTGGCPPRPEIALAEFTSGGVVIKDGNLHGKEGRK